MNRNGYYYGSIVEKDYTEAIEWYRKAAAQGDKEAAERLAKLNKGGRGLLNIFGL